MPVVTLTKSFAGRLEEIADLIRLLINKRFKGQVVLHFDGLGVESNGIPKVEVKTTPMAPSEMTKLLG